MNVIVRAPNWIGDACMSLPFIYSLVNSQKIEKVYIYIRPHLNGLFENLIQSSKIILIPEYKKYSFMKNKRSLPKNIDIAFILTPTFPATFPFVLKGIKNIYGLYSPENKIFIKKGIDTKAKWFRKHHLTRSFLKLLNYINVKDSFKLPFFKFDDNVISKFGIERNNYFIIVPGAAYGPAKRWSFENYKILAMDLWEKFKIKPVILGTEKENEFIKGNIDDNIFLNLSGKTTLKDVINILYNGLFTLTNDSGLMHISYLTGTKTYGVFGSTSPLWTGPLFNSSIFYSKRECSPCFKRTCKFGHYGCLMDIEVNEVYNKIMEDNNETSGIFR